jgi:uncharacterized membrane protein
MLRGILMAAIGGARSITPFATLANAARLGQLPADNGAPKLLAHPLVSAGATALAAGEYAGDKMKTAPDRIVLAGMAARLLTGALAGASLAPKEQRVLAATLGATAAIGAAYLTFDLRMRAIRRFGQTATGAVEDALTLGGAVLLVRGARAAG